MMRHSRLPSCATQSLQLRMAIVVLFIFTPYAISCLSRSELFWDVPFPGRIDSEFGQSGRVQFIPIGFDNATASRGAVDVDGSLHIVGTATKDGNNDLMVAKWNAAGELDLGYGEGGYTALDLGSRTDFGLAFTLLTNGKLIAGAQTNGLFTVTQFSQKGVPDTVFGVATQSLGGNTGARAVAQTLDDKFLAVGGDFNWQRIVIMRFAANGSLDPTFGNDAALSESDGDGISSPDIGSGPEVAEAVLALDDGRFVVAGGRHDLLIAAFLANGSLDKGFAEDGVVTIEGNQGRFYDVQRDTQGRFVAAGVSTIDDAADVVVLRVLPTGVRDSTFGNDGVVTLSIGVGDDGARAVLLQEDGSILIAGWSSDGFVRKMALFRLKQNGALDDSFGEGGLLILENGDEEAWIADIVGYDTASVLIIGNGIAEGVTFIQLLRLGL